MASTDGYLASMELWPANFAPQDWAYCHGQLLTVNQYPALYSLIDNYYGGTPPNTFAVPDMRGRVPVGAGQGPVTNFHQLGEMGGSPSMTLSIAHMPSHNHTATFIPTSGGNLAGTVSLPVKTGLASGSNNPTNRYLGSSGGTNIYYDDTTAGATMAPVDIDLTGQTTGGAVSIQNNGGSYPFSLEQPYTAVNFIIHIENGLYPPRS